MIAIVHGGRDFIDREAAFKALDEARILLGLTKIVCPGDLLIVHWARLRDMPCSIYGINFNKYDSKLEAEAICNQEMLEHSGALVLLAFPGSAGTGDMCERAVAAGLLIYEFMPNEGELDP